MGPYSGKWKWLNNANTTIKTPCSGGYYATSPTNLSLFLFIMEVDSGGKRWEVFVEVSFLLCLNIIKHTGVHFYQMPFSWDEPHIKQNVYQCSTLTSQNWCIHIECIDLVLNYAPIICIKTHIFYLMLLTSLND